jgi:hypothetical protein
MQPSKLKERRRKNAMAKSSKSKSQEVDAEIVK